MTSNWRSVPLGDVCDVVGGGTPAKDRAEFYEGDIPWATVRDMRSEIITDTEFKITRPAIESSSTNVIPKGNVIIATRVGLGKVCLLGQNTAINQDLRAIIPKDGKRLSVPFLFWWLKSVAHLIVAEGTGATVQGVKLPFIKSLAIPLPPVLEQQQVVTILDQAFAGLMTATVNAEKNLKYSRELFEATLVSDIFGDADERRWESTTVAKLALPEKGSMRTGPFGSQLLHSEFVNDGIAVLGIDNAVANEFRWGKKRFITQGKFAQLSRYQVRPGDVLITIMGTCGRCAIVPDNIPVAINTKHLCCISLDQTRCLPKFLHAYFLYHPIARKFLNEQMKGSIMDGLNMGIIQRLPVRLPSLQEQRRIIEKIDLLSQETRRLEANYQNMIKMTENLEQSILQKAFSGELTSPPSQAIREAAE